MTGSKKSLADGRWSLPPSWLAATTLLGLSSAYAVQWLKEKPFRKMVAHSPVIQPYLHVWLISAKLGPARPSLLTYARDIFKLCSLSLSLYFSFYASFLTPGQHPQLLELTMSPGGFEVRVCLTVSLSSAISSGFLFTHALTQSPNCIKHTWHLTIVPSTHTHTRLIGSIDRFRRLTIATLCDINNVEVDGTRPALHTR